MASPPRPCGSWTVRRGTASASDYVPLINGSDTNFSHPFVLTYPSSGYPTDKPRPQLYVANLTGFSNPGARSYPSGVNSNQLWGVNFGPNS